MALISPINLPHILTPFQQPLPTLLAFIPILLPLPTILPKIIPHSPPPHPIPPTLIKLFPQNNLHCPIIVLPVISPIPLFF
ncbi:hypothetical protein, partial [Priestia megaterium]|uniref:hypothetical protein n=1 Tax=Priestia megaterium TaxID=1404 RepID=UPI0037098027